MDTPEDKDENWVSTRMTKYSENGKQIFKISAPEGNLAVLPSERAWKLEFYQIKEEPENILVNGHKADAKLVWNSDIHGVTVVVPDSPVDAEIQIVFREDAENYQVDFNSL